MSNKKCKDCKKTNEKHADLQWAKSDLCLECSKKPKPKFYYDVVVEAMLPATLTYRVYAEDPAKAVEMIKTMQPNAVKHKLIGRKEFKLTVYESGCSIIKLILNLLK